jgi:hypothetical protein
VGFRPRSFFSSGAPPRLGASQHRTQDTSCPSSSEPRTAPRGFAFSYRRCPFSYTTRAPCRRVIRAAGQRHGCPVGRHRHLEVVHASDLLNDAVAGLVPDVHTKVKCVLVAPSKLLARADEVIELATHLLRCICRLLAPRVISLRCQSSDAIGGEADMPRSPAPCQSNAIDPQRS